MKIIQATLVLALAAMPALADFSYKHETKIVGGAMAGPMKMAMKMSKATREAMSGATYIKGNKSANQSGGMVTIYDLDAETITTVNNDKREYSVMSFAEMQQAMARMSEKMSGKKGEANVKYKVDIRDGKKTQDVYGYPAKLTAVAISIESTDEKGNSGAMEMVNDMWLSTGIAGSAEMTAFHQRMGEKLAGAGGQNLGMVGAMMKQKGFEEAMKEFQANAGNLQGVPVLTVMRMAQAGNLDAVMADSGKIPEDKPEAESDSKPSMGGVLRGMGGFGGFGRKKNSEPADEPQQGGGSAALMELATRQFDFSTAPVDESRFAVPAGYKQVESEMKKLLK
ncbi:MAG: hypothetical protein U5J83_00220 [Bryobacterales bacterium]|nr:hypothetical protein [Bryobacterales bacterium]